MTDDLQADKQCGRGDRWVECAGRAMQGRTGPSVVANR